jgi:hypothetical protein
MSGFTAAETSRTVPVQTLAKVYEDRAENYTALQNGLTIPCSAGCCLCLRYSGNKLRRKQLKATSGPNESSRSRNGRIGHSRRQLLANAAFRRQGSNKRSEITVKFQLYTCSQFYSDRRAT